MDEMSYQLARTLYKAVRQFKVTHPGVLEAETARRKQREADQKKKEEIPCANILSS